MSADKIILRVSNKTAYLWNVDDIAALRSEHRICGILTGTLPHLSQQNVFLGVPLVLLSEEVVLLVENGAAVLVDDPTAHLQPSLSELESWNDDQQASFRQQIALTEAENMKKEFTRSLSEEAIKKRKEREERRRLAVAQKLDEETIAEDVKSVETLDSQECAWGVVQNAAANGSESGTSEPLGSSNYTISIPASSEYHWYSPDKATFMTIGAARSGGIWTYPSNLAERARCGVFRSLWEQGYFMGSGIKFGGDYLVYPGDPLRYHSHFVATVIDSPSQPLRPMEIVAHGRLGTATKKCHLLCTWDDEKREVSCHSIEWAGFG